MATHSNVLAWKISWDTGSCGLQFMDRKESDTTELTQRVYFCFIILIHLFFKSHIKVVTYSTVLSPDKFYILLEKKILSEV